MIRKVTGQCKKHKKKRLKKKKVIIPKPPNKTSSKFVSIMEAGLVATNLPKASHPRDISLMSMSTFLVINNDLHNSVLAAMQVSPDKCTWVNDGSSGIVIPPKGSALMVGNDFLHWSRITYRSLLQGKPARLTIWFQGQKS